MAHNIATINNKAAFFGTQPAWHKLGQIVNGAQNWQQAMELAQLNWTVSKHQLLSPFDQNKIAAWGMFRDDNQSLIGVVGDKYTPIQNQYAFDFVDTLMEADNSCHYVSAGALGNGEKIWCLAQINGTTDITGTGDKHEHFLLFMTSHDGSLAATAKLTTVRVVCQNTLNLALKMNGDFTRIKHTKEAETKLKAAKDIISNAHTKISDLEYKLRELSKRKVKKESYLAVMKRLFGDIEESKRAENKVLDITRFYESNDKDMFPEIRGTSYNLLNAITEYTDHAAGIRMTEGRKGLSESYVRAENALFGSGAELKEKALEVIYEVTANDPRHDPKTVYVQQPPSILDSVISNTTWQ